MCLGKGIINILIAERTTDNDDDSGSSHWVIIKSEAVDNLGG